MSEEKPFVKFYNIDSHLVLELDADDPSALISKLVENAEIIGSLRYDYHTTNLCEFTLEEIE